MTATAQEQDPDHLSERLRPLRPLLGRWRTTGTVHDREGTVVARFTGHDEWSALPGARWIAHQSATEVDSGTVHLHQVIGGVHPEGGWQMLAFTEGPFPELTRLVEHGADAMRIIGEGTRATFTLPGEDGVMTATWQRLDDGDWLPWLQARYELDA